MPTINQLSMQSQAAPGDQIPVYSPTNGDAMRLPVSALASYVQGDPAAEAASTTAVDRFTPVTGFNIAMPTPIAETQWVLLQPAATLASGTVTLPPSTSTPDNTEVLVTTTQIITAFSVGLNGAAAVFGAPNALGINVYFRLRFNQATNSWYRVSSLPPAPSSVEYLVVAGGGSGGFTTTTLTSSAGGGGGAGGLRSGSLSVGGGVPYTVTIGEGGAGTTSTVSNGTNSVFNTITSIGGGAGARGDGSTPTAGATGGSGGGGTGHNGSIGGAGGSGTAGQGNNGGSKTAVAGQGAPGGGGSGAVGVNNTNSDVGASGGTGSSSSITGTSVSYAAGGSGGSFGTAASTAGVGAGAGAGGEGRGLQGTAFANGGSATANTGSGGGGAGSAAGGGPNSGGNGGRGVVIIAYANTFPNLSNIGAGLTWTLDTVGRPGFKVYRFTAGTGTIQW